MKLERTLYQRSYLYFIVFFLFMLVAFWFTYFTKLLNQDNYRMHLHGVALILWCTMLMVQPYLIRTNQNALHRTVGKVSYGLVPWMTYSIIDLLHNRLHVNATLGTMDFFAVALVLNALAAFLIFYGLAIYNRKKPTIHARFMICTAFPLFTPITDRIIFIYFPSWLNYLPTIEQNPIAPVVGFAMADLILIGLSIWDWKSHKRWNVFPFALAVLLLYHYSVLNFYQYDFWKGFSQWFYQLY
jgi:hypothetical protein